MRCIIIFNSIPGSVDFVVVSTNLLKAISPSPSSMSSFERRSSSRTDEGGAKISTTTKIKEIK